MLVTLDGLFEGQDGDLDSTLVVWDEEVQKYSYHELRSMDAIYTDAWLIKRLATKMWTNQAPETESTIEFINNVYNIKKVVFQGRWKRLKTMQKL